MRNEDISGVSEAMAQSLTMFRQEGVDRVVLYGVRYLSWKLRIHNRVSALPRPAATAIYWLSRTAVSGLLYVLGSVYSDKYTDADPYKRIWVDPATIEYTTGEIFSKRRGWSVDGNWDERGRPFMHRTYPKAIEQHFVDGLEWDETVLAEKYDGPALEERGAEIDRLYHRIRTEGYKSQRQLLEDAPDAAWSGLNDAMHPLANEIAVDIGRNGELLWNMCGQHRLAIAKVLEIDRIPVQVFRRHKDWQALRDRARRGGEIPESVRDHPDLADVLEDE